MDDSYDWSRFHLHTWYRASIDDVWRAWATPDGLCSFFIGQAAHVDAGGTRLDGGQEASLGDRYAWTFLHDYVVRGEFRAVERHGRIAFSFEGMECEVSFREDGDSVLVRLEQSGCRTEGRGVAGDHLNCRSCWVYFLTNLKSVLEHGADLRDHERPDRNDAIAVFWQPS